MVGNQLEDGDYAAGGVGEVEDVVLVEGAAQDFMFAVGEPFFEDMVTA